MGDESNMSSDEMMKICSSISFIDVWNIYLHDLILSAKFSHSTPTQVFFFLFRLILYKIKTGDKNAT